MGLTTEDLLVIIGVSLGTLAVFMLIGLWIIDERPRRQRKQRVRAYTSNPVNNQVWGDFDWKDDD